MIITLKEAHAIAQKALPGYQVQVSVKYGQSRWQNEIKTIWEIYATKEGSKDHSSIESDEIFSIALARVIAEASRLNAKPIEDVSINDGENSSPEQPPIIAESTENF